MTSVIILIALGIAVLGFILLYNRLTRQRNRVDNAWAQVDVQLKRRHDLIPNLVETVKGYAAHEQSTFEAVVTARSAAQSAGTVDEQAGAEDLLGSTLQRLFALAEQYPDLRASENFQSLQSDLGKTEDRIAVARQIYNDTVLKYNNSVQTIPTNMVAMLTGFHAREFFELELGARDVPEAGF